MAYLARLTNPQGVAFYLVNPFDHHALYGTRDKAEEFNTLEQANRCISLNVYCTGAFWPSERAHAAKVAAELRGWTVDVIPATQESN